jgi:hypothetical protein
MNPLQFTLVCDGPFDVVLGPILQWLIRELPPHWESAPNDPICSGRTLQDRLRFAAQVTPCDLLFIHRDAEAQGRDQRCQEIAEALKTLPNDPPIVHVPVIPVRMTEAWLLLDEAAIRLAVRNPNGRADLKLPRAREVEDLPDPKHRLHETLLLACGLSGRRRKEFDTRGAAPQIAASMADFSPLRQLSAFRALEDDLKAGLGALKGD